MLASIITPALADDWIAQKLRGQVLQLVDGAWQPVERGDAVPETHVIRTLGNARVLFVRGTETVELGPDTQVQIFQRGSDGFTTVKQYFGEVTVEADVEMVKHFAVETPQLVAVVKGTMFVVRSDDRGASVEVTRGAVAVTSEADRSSVTVRAGQEVRTSGDGQLEVSGKGSLPVVVDKNGVPVVDEVKAEKLKPEKVKTNNGKSGDDHGNDDSGNSGNGSDDSDNSGPGSSDDDEDDDDNSGHGNGDDD